MCSKIEYKGHDGVIWFVLGRVFVIQLQLIMNLFGIFEIKSKEKVDKKDIFTVARFAHDLFTLIFIPSSWIESKDISQIGIIFNMRGKSSVSDEKRLK